MVTRRFQSTVRQLRDEPDAVAAFVGALTDDLLGELGVEIREEQRRRALAAGDRDAILADGFDHGFGRDGLAVLPWIRGPFIVCPGGLVAKNRANHRCRFVSVDGTWVWESADLVHEEKRSSPGAEDGFRAVALLPVVEGMALDVVRGRLRAGQHAVEHVVSFAVRRGELVEVAQRDVVAKGLV